MYQRETEYVQCASIFRLTQTIKINMLEKIAIPTREGRVDDPFGPCAYYTIYTIENKQVVATETMPSPQGCGCKSDVAERLHAMGVTVMLAGSMGDGAKNKLESNHIKVVRGCTGDVAGVLKGYLAGFILDSGAGCASHECGNHDHECHSHD